LIVVDTNILACMTFPTKHSDVVARLHEKNPVWEAPMLWKSEFMNVLALYYRNGLIDYNESLNALDFAERLIGTREHRVEAKAILDTTIHCASSSYECEFIVLAKQLGTDLITYDKKLLEQFPDFALTPEDYLQR
jgi:predicted nucleic acid-binding protein